MEQLSTANEIAVAGAGNKQEGDNIQFIVIRLGVEQYGIDINYIENIVRMQQITRVPKVVPYLKGVINLRGEVVPVMSLRLRMGLPEDEITRATRIIILKMENQGNMGVIVDEVKEVVTLNTEKIEKISYDSKEERSTFINGVGRHNEELISLLELSSIAIEENV